MISELFCDTEDWSNDAENSALTTEIKYILNFIILLFFYCITDIFESKLFFNLNSQCDFSKSNINYVPHYELYLCIYIYLFNNAASLLFALNQP